ncbi:TPA: phage terminase small subunit [Vibrio parahaemolyticus]|uniref:phage terminase small subunit n=1 Tax=Vibrio parahaemolyticus TaxID=670 RepID=UPI0002A563EB|nr:phage terminase small subunit [Vibrio parahaemolyticus]AGB11021.1 putative terminase, endonuclease subunit [Vibrio parahaemolyticus BB22OP]MBE4138090.1 terminase [Vibrio parahaemolyticus]MQF42708.1 terminase [Vibrio parahaemolyticus]TOZ80027.1 terminase [Vibrio parahaemolyticus]TOZ99747.1 terminase [Vibrio parahaemolyticus]
MNMSPAMRHRIAHQKQINQDESQATEVNTDSLHIKLIEFEEDRKYLRGFNAIADRIEHKREVLIPKYRPYVESFLEEGEVFENPIFTNLTVWMFDAGELDTAIEWCLKAIELDLPTPDNFSRDWPTFCADFVLQWAELQAERGNSIEPYFSQVFEKVEKEWRLHEEVHAKWYKFAGLSLLRNEEGKPQASSVGSIEVLEKAHTLLRHAHEKHSKIGVKTMLDKIEQRIRSLKSGKNL